MALLETIASVAVFLIVLFLGFKLLKNLVMALVFALVIAAVLYFFNFFGLIG